MESFCTLAEKLKTVLKEDLSPEEIEQLQKTSSQYNDRDNQIKEILKGNDWEVQSFIIKDNVMIYANKNDIKVSIDLKDNLVSIEIDPNLLKKITIQDLREIVMNLEEVIDAVK